MQILPTAMRWWVPQALSLQRNLAASSTVFGGKKITAVYVADVVIPRQPTRDVLSREACCT